MVSPQHRLLIPRALNGRGALAPTKSMLGLAGVRQMHGRRTAHYLHLAFARHEIVFAEGTPCESLYPGAMTLAALPAAVRHALTPLPGRPCPPARRLLSVSEGRASLAAQSTVWLTLAHQYLR